MYIHEIRASIIGLLILAIMLWSIIQIHNYFSKDNIPIVMSLSRTSMLDPIKFT